MYIPMFTNNFLVYYYVLFLFFGSFFRQFLGCFGSGFRFRRKSIKWESCKKNSFLASCMLRHISPNGFCQQIDVLKCLKMQLLNNYFRKWANNLPYITANSFKFMTLVVMKAILIMNNICDFTLKACSTNLLLASSWFLQLYNSFSKRALLQHVIYF